MYRPVPAQIDLPAMEREMLDFWRANDVFHKSLEQTQDGPLWVFYEGPPTANGTPGTHHVEARAFKDVFPRFKTMQGYHVPRKAGWDCHGLPVELAVEKELGFTGKRDIERFGIAEFNAKCRESVLVHVDEFAEMTERMGYWVDMDQAYWTMSTDYIESVWWSLKQIFDKGLLVTDHRVSPYCPRCGTGLSDHELAQGYETIVDPSVYVQCRITGGELAVKYPGLALLVWTTTPWTLVSNTAVAVNPDAEYAVARDQSGRHFVVASELAESALGEVEILETMTGRSLERTPYERPFEFLDIPGAHFVTLADYVTTGDGSGLVHIAPAFGADDLAVGRAYGLPVVNPVGPDGTFAADVPMVGGMFFKKADESLVADLEARGLLVKHVAYEHSYPHCWRCHTPLIYYAQPSWYIRTTQIKDDLISQNESTNWNPETIKWGRYGDWLDNNVDWALSRNRYWGTPLPLWHCPNEHVTAVGSLAELGELSGRDLTELDPHRPFVDEVTFDCPQCQERAERVPEVIDCWYDSGAMPFAQWGYPHRNADVFEARYPADFIAEAIDQTRGWFYTLMAVGTLVFEQSSYKTVLCLGHILDEQGRKMSKHLGNVLKPIPLMDEHGADALRWFMLAGGSPWQARRVGHQTIQEVVRKTLLTYWNTVAFQSLYARAADWEPQPLDGLELTHLDRWALSGAHRTVRSVEAALEAYDTQAAGRALSGYVDDLSNWYVRRSRRRFWAGDPAALGTLHECLRMVTLLMAPFTPFIAERVWQDLFATDQSDASALSVHLAVWPKVDSELIDDDLDAHMSLVRRLVELGRAARAQSGVKTRQPLGRALVSAPGWEALPQALKDEVSVEVNVNELQGLDSSNDLVDVTLKPNFRALGQRFGSQTKEVASALLALDAAQVVDSLKREGSYSFASPVGTVTLSMDDVVITEQPREGWAVAVESGETLALDLEITAELRSLGMARDVIRLLQEERKRSGFDISDRIKVRWSSDDSGIAQAMTEHQDLISSEVLAIEFARSDEAQGTELQVSTGAGDALCTVSLQR